MKIKYALLSSMLGIAGCNPAGPDKYEEINLAPSTHVCSTDQMSRVEAETLFCNKNTSYFSSYCYGSAVIRNCDKTAK